MQKQHKTNVKIEENARDHRREIEASGQKRR
jgi:hypothetical protein